MTVRTSADEAMNTLIWDLASEFDETKPADLFQAIYVVLLGKPRGPRAGWFLSMLGPEFCRDRFRQAAGGTK